MGKKQFLNSMYYRGSKMYDKTTNKYISLHNDALIFTVKDIDTLHTELKVLPHPNIDFYLAKTPQKFHRFSIPIEDCRRVTVPYIDRDHAIAESLGIIPQFTYANRNGGFYEYNKQVMKHPNLYGADIDIQDFYKTKYILDNQDDTGEQSVAASYDICFSDTEVDISTYPEDFPDPQVAPCPINLITNIFAKTKEAITYILYDERVAQEQKDIATNSEKFVNEYLDPILLNEGLTFKFKVFAKEDELIKAYFNDIHERKPDFCMWWNMNFDGNTILNRLKRLGYSDEQIADIVCHPEVPKQYRFTRYIPDAKRKLFEDGDDDDDSDEDDGRSKNSKQKPHPSRLFDWWEIAGYTQMIDQMALYSCMRKRSILPSYKLDAIGDIEAKIGKYDLQANGYSIKDCNIKNFKIFVAYNIRDSFVQYKIEQNTQDINNAIICASNTRISKSQSMSNCVKNEVYLYLLKQGECVGNSVDYDIIEHFQGALVCRPELIQQFGPKVFGCKNSFIFEDCIDSDASSLYPSMMIVNNISKEALFGRVVDIIEGSTERSLGNGVEYFENNKDFENTLFGNLQTIDMSIFDVCNKYMKLPTPAEIISKINAKVLKEAS